MGPILTFTTSVDPTNAVTVIVKGYQEFDAKNTFEGDVFDAAVSFKFYRSHPIYEQHTKIDPAPRARHESALSLVFPGERLNVPAIA